MLFPPACPTFPFVGGQHKVSVFLRLEPPDASVYGSEPAAVSRLAGAGDYRQQLCD